MVSRYAMQVLMESISGNGIIDDERLGLTKFIYFNSNSLGSPAYSNDPQSARDYYNYINGYWKDSTQMIYGGNAHTGTGAYGPACNFMFPANSDTCNWGTGGVAPNGPQYWTEQTAGNQPNDRRGLWCQRSIYFYAGAIRKLDLAYVFGRNYHDSTAWAGVQVMQQRIDSIRKYFINDTTPCGGSFSSLTTIPEIKQQLIIYPNPANDNITCEVTMQGKNAIISIYNIEGEILLNQSLKQEKTIIDVSALPSGVYVVQVKTEKGVSVRKFMKE